MVDTSTASHFNIFVMGQIVSATFSLGPDATEIFCHYEIVAGPDWELLSGLKSGITQSASNNNGNFNDEVVFNMPIELTYKSTSPFGWPQIIICLYGKTYWGTETSLGYARAHVPIFGNATQNVIKTPILIPKCTNMMSEIFNWITGRNPELKNPLILLDNTKTKGLSVESYGEITLQLNTISRSTERLGYDWG